MDPGYISLFSANSTSSNSSKLQQQQKPERKIIEKNRRKHMNSLYSHLYSLVPPNFTTKGSCQVSDRLDRTIDYIQTLKYNLEMIKSKKEKLLSDQKRSQHMMMTYNKTTCKSLDIQIHEISHDVDAVLVTGLSSYSSFCDALQLLDHYSAEVTLANFSSNGHSTFHIRQKQIEADDVCKRLKSLGDDMKKEMGGASSLVCNEVDPSVWNFDFQSNNTWGINELEMILKTNG